MSGILLILLAVLFVICLAFCYSEQGPSRELPFLRRSQKKKG